MTRSNSTLKLNEAGNNEVLFAWLDLAIGNRYDPAVPALEHFLTSQGRRKFVRPLIETLAEGHAVGPADRGARLQGARASYHPVTQRDLDKLKSESN